MTKTAVSTALVLIAMAAAWTSVTTNLRVNQQATTDLITSIDSSRASQAQLYKEAQEESITRILSMLDRQQDQIRGLAEQNLAIGQQNKQLLEGQNKVLEDHGRSLEEVKSGAKAAKETAAEAKEVAQKDQRRTQKAIREIQKPKRSWWGNLFATPTPHQ